MIVSILCSFVFIQMLEKLIQIFLHISKLHPPNVQKFHQVRKYLNLRENK